MPTFSVSQIEVFGRGVLKAEGVVVDKANCVYGGGRNGIMYKVTPDGKVAELVHLPSGSIPNGVTMDRNGDIIYCDLGKEAVMRVTQDGKVSMVADRAGDLPLSLPNFATYDAEGNLYVSNSSTSNIHKIGDELTNPQPKGALCLIRKNGRSEVIATDLYLANGTAIDPREEAVYVLESTRFDCLRIPIKKDGTHGKPEVFSKGFPAIPDGMAFDADGDLYITLPGKGKRPEDPPKDKILLPTNQILKVDKNGNWTMLIDDPKSEKLDHPTNCAFGGPGLQDLYFANLEGEHFSRVHTNFRGHPLYHQR
ncbi:MAG TPA: SMP-30/gluconolactonase/LRE family protein [Candidatus Binataceae bacterium]|nr:SMP-30/gluconolactonase/LRE family protein [Candidatus Binataceae bacterium]